MGINTGGSAAILKRRQWEALQSALLYTQALGALPPGYGESRKLIAATRWPMRHWPVICAYFPSNLGWINAPR
jgi:hypothetical protein